MSTFQGSGFTIALPDDCTDGSAYTFILPENDGFSANLTIRFESAVHVSDLKEHANKTLDAMKKSAADFVLLNQVAGKRGAHEGVMSSYEWGQGKARMRQKQYCLQTSGEIPRVYILTSTDLASNADQSDRVFNQMMKHFKPNEEQLF